MKKLNEELVDIIGVSNITTEKLLRLEALLEKAQYQAYAEGYDDGINEAEADFPYIIPKR